jgi:hypothetical protein
MTAVLLSVAAHLWSQYRVSIPYLVATAICFWSLRHKIDRQLLKNLVLPPPVEDCLAHAGLALQQSDSGLHSWRKSSI